MMINKMKYKGFSLVELMVTIIIIAVVTAAFIPVISRKLKTNDRVVGAKSCIVVGEECTAILDNGNTDCIVCDKCAKQCLDCKNKKECWKENKNKDIVDYNTCKCACTNKCENDKKELDEETCECKCKEPCPDGVEQDEKTCECKSSEEVEWCVVQNKNMQLLKTICDLYKNKKNGELSDDGVWKKYNGVLYKKNPKDYNDKTYYRIGKYNTTQSEECFSRCTSTVVIKTADNAWHVVESESNNRSGYSGYLGCCDYCPNGCITQGWYWVRVEGTYTTAQVTSSHQSQGGNCVNPNNGTECKKCSVAHCKTCSSENNCSECESGYRKYNGKCESEQPE